jgi:hypothetical protein
MKEVRGDTVFFVLVAVFLIAIVARCTGHTP